MQKDYERLREILTTSEGGAIAICELIGYANMVNHCGLLALSPRHVKPVKTLNDILDLFEEISPFTST